MSQSQNKCLPIPVISFTVVWLTRFSDFCWPTAATIAAAAAGPNVMPNCSYRSRIFWVSGASLVSALISPGYWIPATGYRLPVLPDIVSPTLGSGPRSGGPALDRRIGIRGLPSLPQVATTLSGEGHQTEAAIASNLHKHSFNIYPQKRFRCCFSPRPLLWHFWPLVSSSSKSRHNPRTFLAETRNFGCTLHLCLLGDFISDLRFPKPFKPKQPLWQDSQLQQQKPEIDANLDLGMKKNVLNFKSLPKDTLLKDIILNRRYIKSNWATLKWKKINFKHKQSSICCSIIYKNHYIKGILNSISSNRNISYLGS